MGEAFRMYTLNGAKAAHEEGDKGSVTPGKLADLVVLNQDPFSVEPGRLKELRVLMTILGGRIAWQGSDP